MSSVAASSLPNHCILRVLFCIFRLQHLPCRGTDQVFSQVLVAQGTSHPEVPKSRMLGAGSFVHLGATPRSVCVCVCVCEVLA